MENTTARRDRYHHGNLHAALAAAAAKLARAGGPQAVVLREAARQVGVSATAAYRHFANHDDLLHEVKEQALNDLAAWMDAEIAAEPPLSDPAAEALRQLRATGRGYLRYAVAEPGLFRTAFCHTDKPAMESGGDPASTRPYQMLTRVLDTLVEHGKMRRDRRGLAEVAAWAAVHGFAVLLIEGLLDRLPPEAREAAIERTVDMVVEGLCRAD